MKQLFILFLAASLFSCIPFDSGLTPEEHYEQCPYEYEYLASGDYVLEVPMEIIPHQKTYKVGDTITFRMMFSDSILDLNRGERYKIENFPFKPIFHMYHVDNGEWSSAFRENPIHVEDIYNGRYISSTSWADQIRAITVYENDGYHFEFDMIATTPGVFISYVLDSVIFIDFHVFINGRHPEYILDFEGYCTGRGNIVATIVQGDDHIEDFIEELQFIDNEVYRGDLTFFDDKDVNKLGFGRFAIDWRGVYCFEVVE